MEKIYFTYVWYYVCVCVCVSRKIYYGEIILLNYTTIFIRKQRRGKIEKKRRRKKSKRHKNKVKVEIQR